MPGQHKFRRSFFLADHRIADGCCLTCQPTADQLNAYFDILEAVFRDECGWYKFAADHAYDPGETRFVLLSKGTSVIGGMKLTLGDGSCIRCMAPLIPKHQMPPENEILRMGRLVECSSLVLHPVFRMSEHRSEMLAYVLAYATAMGFDFAVAEAATTPHRADLLYACHGFVSLSDEVFNPGAVEGPHDYRPNARLMIQPLHSGINIPPHLIKPVNSPRWPAACMMHL